MQVHDEIILEGPEGGAKDAFSIVKQCMEMPFAPSKVRVPVFACVHLRVRMFACLHLRVRMGAWKLQVRFIARDRSVCECSCAFGL
jgi:hypothetical protein